MHKSNETILEVNLSTLEKNYNYLRSKLNHKTSIIGVIKAYGYGHGDIKIAKKLEEIGVNIFWVADFEEGISLRNGGIKSKIIVANPGIKSYDYIIRNKLDVVIHNLDLLEFYCSIKNNINIHLKFNTGMNRYGFDFHEIDDVVEKLKSHNQLKIVSICSHLSSANFDKNNTEKQIFDFEKIALKVEHKLNYKLKKHILNSNGLLNFNTKQYDYVRLGISLFGGCQDPNLEQISRLTSVVSQNRNVDQGSCIGYEPSFIAPKKMNVSIIPIGYADGLNRRLGNGVGIVKINEKSCPILGNVCMDSIMVDTSSVKCKLGDKVEIFGPNNSILSLSEKLQTIPYEIYSTLNRRIKRVYFEN